MTSNLVSLQLRPASIATIPSTPATTSGWHPNHRQQTLAQFIKPGPLGGCSGSSPTNGRSEYKRGSGHAPLAFSPSQSAASAPNNANFQDSSTLDLDLQQAGFRSLKNADGTPIYFATPRTTEVAEAGATEVILSTLLTREKRSLRKKRDSIFKLAAVLFCDALESTTVGIGSLRNLGEGSKILGGLSGNFAPAESEFGPSAPLHVIGTLPNCLNGEFVRVGPNPKFKPTRNYSWFDGDGMLHGLRIKHGKVCYTSRYVRTARLSQEEHYGSAKFIKMGDCLGRFGLFWALLQSLRVKLGVLDVSNGYGTANTALEFHNGELLCLQETDKPYSIRVHDNGDLETIGQASYDGKLNHPFTAHPKIDPVTGEMFVLGNDLLGKSSPFVTYRVVSKGGEMRDPVAIHTSGSDPSMMHDFAITEHYAVFLDCPLFFKPMDMVLKDQGVFSFDESKPTRFGILPRYAGDDSLIRWFEVPACMILHTANAWEEGEEVVLVACRSPNFTLESVDNRINCNDNDDRTPEFVSDLYEFRLNLRTGEASQKRLGDFQVLDFPGINRTYQGRRNRYVYTAIIGSGSNRARIEGVAKFDLTKEPELGEGKLGRQSAERSNLAGVFWFGEGRGGSEVVFVPSGLGSEEDDGYLVTYVHDENEDRSEAIVIDARSMSADPVAIIELPTRVPYGFHGLFVPEQQLSEQSKPIPSPATLLATLQLGC